MSVHLEHRFSSACKPKLRGKSTCKKTPVEEDGAIQGQAGIYHGKEASRRQVLPNSPGHSCLQAAWMLLSPSGPYAMHVDVKLFFGVRTRSSCGWRLILREGERRRR